MKSNYRIKVVKKGNLTLYYPQIKKWYGWCYLYKRKYGLNLEIYFITEQEAERYIIKDIYFKKKPEVSYINYPKS
jgi:hypothetical protein